jgi:CHAT domain-containing protein/tetratricopeptide (TPR) repeat protein
MMSTADQPELATLEWLRPGITGLLEVRSWDELRQVVERHPELLTEESDVLLGQLAVVAREQGDDDTMRVLERYRALLRRSREHGINSAFAEAKDHASTRLPPQLSALLEPAFQAEERFEQTGDLQALDAVVNAWLHALDRFDQATESASPQPAATILNGLAGALLRRYWATRQEDDLLRASEALERATVLAPLGSPERLSVLSNLGTTLLARHERSGDLGALERAVQVYNKVLAETPVDSPELPSHLNNAAVSLLERYQRTGRSEDLERAIDVHRQAIRLTPSDSSVRRSSLTNLGNALLQRHQQTGAPEDLDAAAQAFEAAVAATPPDSPNLPTEVSNLANVALLRYQRSGHPDDLDMAVDAYRQAVRVAQPHSANRLTSLSNLGTSLRARYERSGDPTALGQAVDAYRESCLEGLDVDDESVLAVARTWGDWAWQRQSWAEAAEAYAFGLRSADRLIGAQLLRRHKEAWLRAEEGLPARAAYAMAMIGDLQEAVVALDRGRSLLLAETLERERADLDRLQTIGRADLLERYRQAADHVSGLERDQLRGEAIPLMSGEESLRVARAELESVVAEIRAIPGYERFLDAPSFDDLLAAAATHPLVYLAATDAGGLALVLGGGTDAAVTLLWFPELTAQTLREEALGYIRASQRNDMNAWMTALDQTTRWLWDALMGPLIEALSRSDRVSLIPTGLLGFLPLHAAWTPDPSAPTGRRYALDELLITYAPNARVLRLAKRQAENVPADGVLTVKDPRPVSAPPLIYASNEIQAVISAFPRALLLQDQEATRSAVLAVLDEYPVLHFACLGAANLGEPLASGLLMANDEILTLRDFLERRLPKTRLAVLSASETALPGLELPDELIGLPAGLLQAGVVGVISALWSVPDLGTMLLMIRFYELWRRQGLEPAEALRQAQRWMRDTPNAVKRDHFPGVSALEGASVPLRARNLWEEARSHANPYQWAAFAYFGA